MDSQKSSINTYTGSRKSNLELLRIVSIILIIMHHYSVHGGFELAGLPLSINKIIVQLLSLGGKLGVNCFILITGYFMVDSNFKIKKLIKIIMEVIFYSVLCLIIFYGFGISEMNIKIFIKSLLPITYGLYWFASTYVVLYIFSPYINLLISGLNKSNHIKLIFILITLWSIIPTFTAGDMNFSNLGWFITLYIIAAYIKLYPNKYFNYKFNLVIALFAYGTVILSVIVFDIVGLRVNLFAVHATYFMGINKLPILVCSIALFLGFKNLKLDNNRLLNNISKSMFGVYLIHENIFVRPFLWLEIFKNYKYIDSPFLILHAFITVCFVFIICTIIDQLRILVIEKPMFLFIDSRQGNIDVIINRNRERILKLLTKMDNTLLRDR